MRCGVASEVAPLTDVLLHRPGREVEHGGDPDAVQMMEPMDARAAAAQHDGVAEAFRRSGARVHYVEPRTAPPPNLLYVADLLFMTPEGAIVGRPAGVPRAGEERLVAEALARLGVPVLRTVRGRGVFEGADAAWLDARTVMLAEGMRSNREGVDQVASLLGEMGVGVVHTRLAPGTMHLMGQLRFVDERACLVGRPGLGEDALAALRREGYRVLEAPDERELGRMAINLVTLAPREVLLPAGNPRTLEVLAAEGVRCVEVPADELAKGGGGIGCMTGVLRRA
jgi:N-dimethylarginine dimethylaminohydrolase